MTIYEFNRHPVLIEPRTVTEVTEDQIEATPVLRRASLENAVLFGGPLVRRALQSAPLKGDRDYVLVDTKVTMLMKGWFPAIPGWHTDGVPRGDSQNPADSGAPSMIAQQYQSLDGSAFAGSYAPRFHTLIVGVPCLTKFMASPLSMDLEHGEDSKLYTEMTETIESIYEPNQDRSDQDMTRVYPVVYPEAGAWASWDWWNIHTATESQHRGWRLLIRVTESNVPPVAGDFIRSQSQVYVPLNFGW